MPASLIWADADGNELIESGRVTPVLDRAHLRGTAGAPNRLAPPGAIATAEIRATLINPTEEKNMKSTVTSLAVAS